MEQEQADNQKEELQFDQAEYSEPEESGPPSCDSCNRELSGTYFDVNGVMTCEPCRFKLEELVTGHGFSSFLRALACGVAGGAVGAALYYAVLAISGYEVGLLAIVVGFLVGRGVRWGCRSRGGWLYQTIAVLLTYLAIVSCYIPQIIREFWDQAQTIENTEAPGQEAGTTESDPGAEQQPGQPGSADPEAEEYEDYGEYEEFEGEFGVADILIAVVALIVLAVALPFLAFEPIHLLILAFGLFEAWRQNKRLVLQIEGPLQLGQRPGEPGLAEDSIAL